MSEQKGFEFVSMLASELESGEIQLPSLPDVVIKIRNLLERDQCDFEQVSQVVSMDPVLVSRLLVFANSAYHNRSQTKIENVDAAISRLGFETVRNTALSIAVKQLYFAKEYANISDRLRRLWARSMKLSTISMALAKLDSSLNEDTAYMCGLLHDVGRLYILSKAKDFPDFIGDDETLAQLIEEWHQQIGRSIVDSWGFSTEVSQSVEPLEFIDEHTHLAPTMPDVLLVARLLLDAGESQDFEHHDVPSAVKLRITEESIKDLWSDYREKLTSVQQAMSF